MAETVRKRVLITNLTVNDDGFAVVPESGEGVYIPPGVTRATGLVAGEYRVATLIENDPERKTSTKWMGIFVDPVSDDGPLTSPDRLQAAMDALDGTYMSTSELAAEIKVSVTEAREVLNKLFRDRRVARADVHFGSERRAINVLWALAPDVFLQ